MTACFVDPSGVTRGVLSPPPSKSDAQRSLVLAHACRAPQLEAFMKGVPMDSLPEDVRVVASGLQRLASEDLDIEIDCGDGGAPFRLLLTQAALALGKRTTFRGSARLGARPHDPLFVALEGALGPQGLRLTRGSPWPVMVDAPRAIQAFRCRVSGAESSQYSSSLLLGACAYAFRSGETAEVELTTPVASVGYLRMTVDWMRRAGFSVDWDTGGLRVRRGVPPETWPTVPGDWSSLGYLLIIAWRAETAVRHVDQKAEHPDRTIIDLLASIGLETRISTNHVATVKGTATRGLVATAATAPDLMPTLAALACVLPAPSTLQDVAILRHKESDRLDGIRSLVAAIGGTTDLHGDSLTIVPPSKPSATFSVDAKNDHRMAMAATTLAILSGSRLRLEGPACVAKSFPSFWSEMTALGVRLEPT